MVLFYLAYFPGKIKKFLLLVAMPFGMNCPVQCRAAQIEDNLPVRQIQQRNK